MFGSESGQSGGAFRKAITPRSRRAQGEQCLFEEHLRLCDEIQLLTATSRGPCERCTWFPVFKEVAPLAVPAGRRTKEIK